MYYVPVILEKNNSPKILGIYSSIAGAIDCIIRGLNLYSDEFKFINDNEGYIDDECYQIFLDEFDFYSKEEQKRINEQHDNYLSNKMLSYHIVDSFKKELLDKHETSLNDTKCWIKIFDQIQE